jgi:predicted transposase YdaD
MSFSGRKDGRKEGRKEGKQGGSFSVLIARHLLIMKQTLESILLSCNLYCTILTFMHNWHRS